jgi:hypothetical protein
VLIGGGETDILDGGPSDNIIIQSARLAPNANGGADGSIDPAARVALLGQYMASSSVTASDGHGGTPVADPPSSEQPLLAQPHA